MKIFLIGMPGSGKTTLGKQLASKLLVDFVDLDYEIERREQKSIADIFSQQGEDYFRQVESSVLHQWAGSSKSFVMATGGGAPCFYDGIKVINDTGLSFFLNVPVVQLAQRLEHKTDRPLLKVADRNELQNKLELLRRSRLPFYEKATFTVDNPVLSVLLEKIHFKK